MKRTIATETGAFFPQPPVLPHQEPQRDHAGCHVVVPPLPGAHLVVVEATSALAFSKASSMRWRPRRPGPMLIPSGVRAGRCREIASAPRPPATRWRTASRAALAAAPSLHRDRERDHLDQSFCPSRTVKNTSSVKEPSPENSVPVPLRPRPAFPAHLAHQDVRQHLQHVRLAALRRPVAEADDRRTRRRDGPSVRQARPTAAASRRPAPTASRRRHRSGTLALRTAHRIRAQRARQ